MFSWWIQAFSVEVSTITRICIEFAFPVKYNIKMDMSCAHSNFSLHYAHFVFAIIQTNFAVVATCVCISYWWPTLVTLLIFETDFNITKTRLFKYIENFTTKNWKFSDKNSNISFYISAQNRVDCGYSLEPPRRGGSNEYPQSMLLSRNKKNNVYPCKHQFYYIKVGFKGVKII